jgi:hypothetical protein
MVFGENPSKAWKQRGSAYTFYDFPQNQERGNISRIALYWLANDSIDRKDEIMLWEARASKPLALAGFHFQVFVIPPGFTQTANWKKPLFQAGEYRLEIDGYPKSTKIFEHFPPAIEVRHWEH